jgi:DNA-binding CsgD family transcriptional regulator
LFISVNTVKFHMRSIFERLGVRNRMAAVRILTDAASG